jgi:hypothetical protein
MRKTREILRLKFEARLSHRQIGRACGVSCSPVTDDVGRFQAAGLLWLLPAAFLGSALEARGQSARRRRRLNRLSSSVAGSVSKDVETGIHDHGGLHESEGHTRGNRGAAAHA